eukprot:CAMPEP_0180081544 /NCGR_PEP_ID=MMETSP0985-20121206/18199_1 /TAXON_ID=483367 /ORGANISM="non described non described, Strain CCMP 2436" /LENGTH=121 /DNA_ID=CAMNT_0022014775 /DNA_START=326 /DNA_END=690 /DNA_ORIENTATION=-
MGRLYSSEQLTRCSQPRAQRLGPRETVSRPASSPAFRVALRRELPRAINPVGPPRSAPPPRRRCSALSGRAEPSATVAERAPSAPSSSPCAPSTAAADQAPRPPSAPSTAAAGQASAIVHC